MASVPCLCDDIDENGCRMVLDVPTSFVQHRRHTVFASRRAMDRESVGRKLMAAWGVAPTMQEVVR
jgi:hypothetical protein